MAGQNILVVEDNATLLSVVESALLRAEFRVDSAADTESSLALARSNEPALILIDSLLARASDEEEAPASGSEAGLGLCQALVADAALAKIPVVLMVPRGRPFDSAGAQTPNVVDTITKPFSPDALVDVVEQAIGRNGSAPHGAPASHALAALRSRPTRMPALDPLGGGDVAGEGGTEAAGSLAALGVAIVDLVVRSLGAAPRPLLARTADESPELTATLAESLSAAALGELLVGHGFATDRAARTRARDGARAARENAEEGAALAVMDLAGQLASVPLGDVMSLLAQQTQTGSLRVTVGDAPARVDLFFRAGRIELAVAVGIADEFLLGRFAVDAGYISAATLAYVLHERAEAAEKPPLFGRDLIARALITSDQLKDVMSRQTAELIYECLRWPSGRFDFRQADALPELADDAALALSVDALLLEGLRRVDEWRVIEHDIHSFDLVFVRDDKRIAALPAGSLTREEILVLDALTGKRTVRELVRALRMGSFDVTKILYRLRRAQLIRQRVDAIATH